ncbi:MAG: type II toxin-antitoxin system VapC family toxin [Terriglobales bacterium]
MPVFLDTSALVKLYVRESGTDWMLRLTDETPTGQIIISALAEVEFHAALRLLERTAKIETALRRELTAAYREDARWRYARQPVTDHVLGLAVALVERHPLRAYDAVQLASCLAYAAGSTAPQFVSSDRQLVSAAAAEGLDCRNPEDE